VRLRENLARTGLQARVVTADALQWVPDAVFDAVLLDAPCSATGTIRRHPDLPFLRQAGDIAGLVALQAQLIDRALGFLKPGGRLVYCTCSLLQDEGEAQVAAGLARHPGLVLLRPEVAGIEPAWMGERGLRLRPDYWAERGGMDGFYMACLQAPA
jgi:16S rRNA (cytosine967-C5)-methyltransferase